MNNCGSSVNLKAMYPFVGFASERFCTIGELEGGVFVGFASERFCTIGELEGDVLVDCIIGEPEDGVFVGFAELEHWLLKASLLS